MKSPRAMSSLFEEDEVGFSLDVFPPTPSGSGSILRRSRSQNNPVKEGVCWSEFSRLYQFHPDVETTSVLHCSEPQPVQHITNKTSQDAQTRINDAVSAWSAGSGTDMEPGPIQHNLHARIRKRSPSFRKIKHRLSRAQSRDRIHVMAEDKRSHSDHHPFSAKFTFQDNFMDLVEVDPRMTSEIALYYLQQKLPIGFPLTVLKCFYEQMSSVKATQDLLIERGWGLEIPEPENLSVPAYYFGSWSYDCWSVFEGKPVGSFITCHKPTRYYVMYKDSTGHVLLASLSSGPRVPLEKYAALQLTCGITRPPRRYSCNGCGNHTPCELLEKKEEHANLLSSFVITFPSVS